MATEFEIKYRTSEDTLRAIAAAFPGGMQIPMTTTYYDTGDLALSRRRWTLRHRQEGQSQICTLKTPGDGNFSRGEWECACDDIRKAVPILAAASGLPELNDLTKTGLTAVCGARFLRIAVAIPIGQSTAELALDQGILIHGDKTCPLCECEIELKSGDPQDILAFSQSLAEKYRLIPEERSKFARAKALGQEE